MSYPKPARFAHLVLKTYDKARLEQWYTDVLQMQPVVQNPVITLMTYDDEHHRLGLLQMQGEPVERNNAPGMQHVAFAFDGLRSLLEHNAAMREKGISHGVAVNHGGTISLYYVDPDGNGVEGFCDVFATPAECNEFLAGPSFQKNPFGVPFDPAEWLDRLNAGESVDTLVAYPDAPFDPEFAASMM